MDKNVFLTEFARITESSSILTFGTQLVEIEGYDSLLEMTIAAWISDSFNKKCTASQVGNFLTIDDVYTYIFN